MSSFVAAGLEIGQAGKSSVDGLSRQTGTCMAAADMGKREHVKPLSNDHDQTTWWSVRASSRPQRGTDVGHCNTLGVDPYKSRGPPSEPVHV
jgi:hypothetical protein